MLLVTKDQIGERKLEELGIAKGSTVQSVHFGKDFMSGLKTLVGGELTSYNEMMAAARTIATKRMEEDAAAMGADAVVCVTFPLRWRRARRRSCATARRCGIWSK